MHTAMHTASPLAVAGLQHAGISWYPVYFFLAAAAFAFFASATSRLASASAARRASSSACSGAVTIS